MRYKNMRNVSQTKHSLKSIAIDVEVRYKPDMKTRIENKTVDKNW